MDFGGWGDTVSSYECGAGVELTLCNDRFDCPSGPDIGSAGHIRASQLGYNDEASEYHIVRYDPSTRGAVTAFNGPNCTDISSIYYASSDPKSRANYPLTFMDTD